MSVASAHQSKSTAVVVAIYNLCSQLIHESPSLTGFSLQEQGVGFTQDWFIREYIRYL